MNHPPQSTGISIPVDKKGVFIVAFEKILLDRHNIIATFEEAKNGSSCEVKFIMKQSQNFNIMLSNCIHAKEFIRNNLHMLETKVNKSKKAMPSTYVFNGSVLSPRRLSLRSSSTIDLTEDSFQASEPEVIVLDDCLDTTIRSRNSNKTIEIIDLEETLNSFPRTSRSIGNEIQVVGIKSLKSSVQSRLPDVDVRVVKSISGPRNDFSSLRRSKRKINSCIETPRKSKAKQITYSEERLSYMSNDSMLSEASENKVKEPKRKKRKLCDVSNIIPKVSSKIYTPNTKPLSDVVLKYYTDIHKAINKGRKSRSPKQKRLLNKVTSNKKSNLSPSVKTPKAKMPNPPRKGHIPSFTNKRSPGPYKRQKRISNKNMKCEHESNIFNPNPNVDIEGLRPIAIDGSNVAVGHGKGTFSTKGLKICVDYFFNQGHRTVKVFLPLHRQNCFSEALLEELKSKCDMVFTPSRVINGKQTASYDDRFIVQYAVEFGAVIVSTDNFRDLLAENPRWTKAIQERLLMFTWIDDFLMFPMDPLGKNGPNLNEFLKF